MKYFLTSILMLFFVNFYSQNLVSNGSFEIYSECPSYPPEDIFIDQITLADGWTQPTFGTCDYYHICGDGLAAIPDGLFGYQYPSIGTDSAFAGIQSFFNVENTFREYLSTNIPELEIGDTYNVTLDVNIGELGMLFIDCLGVHFKTNQWDFELFDIELIHDTQVDYSSFGLFDNTETWVTLTESFIADSAYTEMTIGCFKENSEINIDVSGTGNNPSSYFLIDNVCVTKPTGSCSETVGLAGFKENELILYPNPSAGDFQFNKSGNVRLYNSLGEIVFESFVFKGELVSLLDLSPGIYHVQHEVGKVIETKKLIIE